MRGSLLDLAVCVLSARGLCLKTVALLLGSIGAVLFVGSFVPGTLASWSLRVIACSCVFNALVLLSLVFRYEKHLGFWWVVLYAIGPLVLCIRVVGDMSGVCLVAFLTPFVVVAYLVCVVLSRVRET